MNSSNINIIAAAVEEMTATVRNMASASEETGNDVTVDMLKEVIQSYLDGECDGDKESIYDGAVYACGYLARHCLGEDPDEDVDYEVEWISEDDGAFTAQVMLS